MATILEKLNKSAIRFLEPLTPDETYRLIIAEALRLVKVDHASIYLDLNKALVKVAASSPILYNYRPRRRGGLYKAFQINTPSVMEATNTIKIHPELAELKVKSILHIPLPYGKKAIGLLTLYSSKSEKFNQSEFKILQLFGSMASMAIRKAQLYSEVTKALEVRDMFISMASHELRTPLTTINGYIQLLNSKLAKDCVEGKWAKQLSYESVRLTNLVKELLDINRIRTGQLDYYFKECSIRTIIERAIKSFKFDYPSREIIIEDRLTLANDIVIGDFDKLLQVLTNVLENAAEFSPANTDITLVLEQKGSSLVISIKDHGKGINKKELPKIFEGAYMGGDPAKKGMGIGLFLVNNIIERHQGAIKFHSRKGQGTTIDLMLPKVRYDRDS